ncbi:MAG: hypothetical protein WD065_19580 [Planctomycetaceae bacterium]
MDFEIISELTGIETIATGTGVRDRARLRKIYGRGRWRKRKGIPKVRLIDGTIHLAEIHWYEARGIGKREYKLNLHFWIEFNGEIESEIDTIRIVPLLNRHRVSSAGREIILKTTADSKVPAVPFDVCRFSASDVEF